MVKFWACSKTSNAKLDSLIFTSDKKVIMITSEYCKYREDSEHQELWEAGKTVLKKHPLFSQNHHLDSIKKVLKTQYYFQNDIEEVVFIGYDNEKNTSKKRRKKRKKHIPESQAEMSPEIKKEEVLVPSIDIQNLNNGNSPLLYTLLGIVLIFSLILALFTQKFSAKIIK